MGEYEEIVERIPVPERPIGPLAGLATRLDYIGPRAEETSTKIEAVEERIKKLEYALSTLEFPEGVMPHDIEQIPFSYNITSGKGVILTEYAPFSGYIKEVSPHWPDGCDALVDIKVGHGVKQFCPDEDYLALNNATPTYPFNEWVSDHEEIWVELRNRSANSHRITVTVILEGIA